MLGMLQLNLFHLLLILGYDGDATGVSGGARLNGAPPVETLRDVLSCL